MTALHQPAGFRHAYLAAWTEKDPARRTSIIRDLWSEDGSMAVSSTGETLRGVDEVVAHIGRVHDDLVAGKGLSFGYDQEVASGDALLLRWSMKAPNGATVGRGVGTVTFAADGRIATVHMFMGVE